ncbi:MAG: hypothetical protein A2Z34_02305 [Planctomycetes bacterium RBG_16_59_8]|nr:MAG: hypothetical protein A2Z34_02305 [Planctomycetes bacterium RBG_16_59_8]
MLHLDLQTQSGVPIFRQVMDQVRYYIASGAMKPGDQLPTVRDLAQDLHVNPMTISKAYSLLQMQGVLELRKGVGVFVSQEAPTMSVSKKESVLRPIATKLAVEAAQLQIPPKRVHELVDEALEKMIKNIPNERSK